jgi:hypothetical protein
VQNGTRKNVPWNETNCRKKGDICRFGHVDDRLPRKVRWIRKSKFGGGNSHKVLFVFEKKVKGREN